MQCADIVNGIKTNEISRHIQQQAAQSNHDHGAQARHPCMMQMSSHHNRAVFSDSGALDQTASSLDASPASAMFPNTQGPISWISMTGFPAFFIFVVFSFQKTSLFDTQAGERENRGTVGPQAESTAFL